MITFSTGHCSCQAYSDSKEEEGGSFVETQRSAHANTVRGKIGFSRGSLLVRKLLSEDQQAWANFLNVVETSLWLT